jgi:hypothetical protein
VRVIFDFTCALEADLTTLSYSARGRMLESTSCSQHDRSDDETVTATLSASAARPLDMHLSNGEIAGGDSAKLDFTVTHEQQY